MSNPFYLPNMLEILHYRSIEKAAGTGYRFLRVTHFLGFQYLLFLFIDRCFTYWPSATRRGLPSERRSLTC